MSTHCSAHPDDPQVAEGCWGCMQEGEVLLTAFRAHPYCKVELVDSRETENKK